MPLPRSDILHRIVDTEREDMDNKKLGLGLLAVTFACWIVTMTGMIIGGSHRWVEPFQQVGWIFFIGGFLVLYLRTGREIIRPNMAKLAWGAGAVAVVLFLLSLVFNAASVAYKTWYEAFEAAGSIAMLVTVMSAIWSVGGWKTTS